MDDTDITDWPENSLGKKFQDLERNFRCLICRDIYENPQILNCGHTYCSLCIRRHLDHALNSNNSDRCPDCKEKSEVFHLKPNLNIASAILAFKVLRPEMLNEMTSFNDKVICSNSVLSRSRSKRDRDERVLRKLPHLSFHGKSKKYVKDAIEKLCSSSNIRPCVDGDQSELERFYRDIVHLNNAQIDSRDPLSFDEIVKESTKGYIALRKEAKANPASRVLAEKMKNGEIPTAAINSYISLIQKVRADSLKLKELNSSMKNSSSSCSSSNSSSSSGNVHGSDEKPNEISEELEPGEYTDGVWRIMMSDKLGRPFFYNTNTKVGQFTVPEEFTEAGLMSEGLSAATSAERGRIEARSTPSNTVSEVMDLCASDASEVEVAESSNKKRLRRGSKRRKGDHLMKSRSQNDQDGREIEEGRDMDDKFTSAFEENSDQSTNSDLVQGLSEKGGESQGNAGPNRDSDPKNHTDNIFKDWNAEDSDDDDVVEVASKEEPRRLSDEVALSGSRSGLDGVHADPPCGVEKGSSGDSGIGLGLGSRQPWSDPSKWNCSRCTYENELSDSSCTMCAQPNSSLQPRRSQRDRDSIAGQGQVQGQGQGQGQGQQSGSIMRGFALALSQQQPSVEIGHGTSSRGGNRLSSSGATAPHRDASATKSQTISSRRR